MALDAIIRESSSEKPLLKDLTSGNRAPRQRRKKRTNNKENLRNIKNPMKPTLSRPKTPPRISLDDPAFRCLTNAEKLNDPKYRELVYRSYPNEPTCSCGPKGEIPSPLICPADCMQSCCIRLRNPKKIIAKLKRKPPESIKTICLRNVQPPAKMTTHRTGKSCPDRLRGGADVEQIYSASTRYAWNEYEEADYSYCVNNGNTQYRLEGGGGGGTCSCSGGFSTIYDGMSPREQAITATEDPCRPGQRAPIGPTPSCVCLGKAAQAVNRSGAKCSKKPCQGIDCLIRAFKEAQDFVDSLGKVPGLAGLGLMDPSESPFFGRDLDKDYARQEMEKRRGQPGASGFCEAPCNTQPIPAGENISSPYAVSAPPLPIPGRTGIVREGIATMPDAGSLMTSSRQRRREERREERNLDMVQSAPGDSEAGPCGEPKCKARQLRGGGKPFENTLSYEANETTQKSSAANQKMQSVKGSTHTKLPRIKSSLTKTPSVRSTTRISDRTKKHKSVLGSGDRAMSSKQPIKVSKRVMRYIYTLGDVYPGIHYGHKTCIDPRMRVPANMGWLWNTTAIAGKFKPRIGWRPGAIGRYLHEMLRQAKLGAFRVVHRPRSAPYSRSKKSKGAKSLSLTALKMLQPMREMGDEPATEPPTLHIHRKDGTYYVTMYPIKQETDEQPVITEPMKPLQFKIVKNKDDASDATSSTASDMEIEFSPPAALNKNRKKPDVIHEGTQVRQDQILEVTKVDDGKKKDKKGKGAKDKKPVGARNR